MVLTLVLRFVKPITTYTLCLFYTSIVAIALAVKYILNSGDEVWKPKERLIPPKCLSDPKYGEHKYMNVNGVKIHYVEKGNPEKPLMLFVHGFPEFWYSWRHQIEEFSNDYWTVAVDMRGFGDSDKPVGASNYTMDILVNDLKGIIENLGHKKCILVAHGWGAVIGWAFINKHMDMVYKYVLLGAPSTSVFTRLLLTTSEQFFKSWYIYFFQMPVLPELVLSMDDYRAFEKAMCGNDYTKYITEEDIEAYKHTFSKPGALTAGINYYRANEATYIPSPPPSTKEFAPGFYILGDKDAYISKMSGLLLQRVYPKLKYEVVLRANHFVQQDDPVTLNKYIRRFVNGTEYKVERICN